ETPDGSGVNRKPATAVAMPSRKITMAARLRDSSTTIEAATSNNASPTSRDIGSPSSMSGATTNMRQIWMTNSAVRLGSLNRSCQAGIDFLPVRVVPECIVALYAHQVGDQVPRSQGRIASLLRHCEVPGSGGKGPPVDAGASNHPARTVRRV